MQYELRLETQFGIIFKRYFENLLDFEYENEHINIINELGRAIENELISETERRYGNFIPKTPDKNEFYHLTLRNKNGIFVIVEIDITNFPSTIKHNLDVRKILPTFVKQFKSI